MASLQAKIDAVKASVSSTSTCTLASVVTLKELLLTETESPPSRPKSAAARPTKTPTGPRSKSRAGKDKTLGSQGELLSARERTVLATHVINVTIKSLTEAAKPAPPTTPSKRNAESRQVTGKKTLRRSLSAPLSPMQPRALNRVVTSPSVSVIHAKPHLPTHSTGCLATVECARIAFTALRSIKGPIQANQSDFQLETGMCALAGKLVTLGLHDQAMKELRVLKRRFDGMSSTKASNNSKTGPESNSVTSGIADLLDFQCSIPKQSLPTITSYQMQVLKLVATTKKPAHIEAILPYLGESVTSSPLNLLSMLAKDGEKEAAKAARQMATMSQVILSLAPSISSQEDVVAAESRLSPSPSTAYDLQSLAFRIQLRWWKLAGHEGSIDDDVLSPFSRCARAYSRRQKPDSGAIYQTLSKSFDELMQLIRSHKHRPTTSFNSPLSSIYQLLGSAAHKERRYDDAYRWFQEWKGTLTPGQDSSVRTCSVSARLLAVALKKSGLDADVEPLLTEVIEGLDGSLSGTVAELNELLESLALTRRSVVGLLINVLDPKTEGHTSPDSLNGLLKTFVLKYPRFVRRWMGLPPGKDASAKQVLQFDQRRQLVSQSIGQVLDATLMVIRSDIQSGANEWQPIDDVLQHCVSLLESLSISTLSISKAENLGNYPIKISSLYFSIFSQLRKRPTRSKEENKQLLQALNRSIDSVKDCTVAEKEKAQLSTKLEVFADLCKSNGRSEDAVKTLRSICTNMAETGALADVATALASQPPSLAWNMNERSSVMSRTLRSIAKLDRSWNDWTFFLPEAERAAVLEHLMHISNSSTSSSYQPLRLHDAGLAALLRIYSLDKYPIRRLRVLLHLSYQNLGDDDHLPEIISLVEEVMQQIQKKDKGEDAALTPYIPHLQAYYASVSALSDKEAAFPTSSIKEAVATWKSIIQTCQSQTEVFAKIDDPQGLLEHLRSLHQLSGLRGESHLQLSLSELSIAISRIFVGAAKSNSEGLILNHSQLVAQYVNIGLFPQALKTLEQTEELLVEHDGLSRRVLADFYITQAEYYTGTGNMDTAMNCLAKASEICSSPYSSWAQNKSQATMMISMTSLLQSIVTLQTGDIQDALLSIKNSVRILSHDWSKLETQFLNASVGSELSLAEISTSSAELKTPKGRVIGPRFWNLASPLLRSLLHISSVYAHIGMFQETIYYAESAWKIAESTQSSLFQAQVAAWTGSVYLKAGKLTKALATFKDAEEQLPHDISSSRVHFARQIGEFYWEIGEDDKAANFLKIAEETAQLLSRREQQTADEAKEVVVAKARPAAASKSTRTTRTTKPKAPVASKTPKRTAAPKSKSAAPVEVAQLPDDIYSASLYAANILSRTLGLIHQKEWAAALVALEKLKDLPKLVTVLSQEQVMTAVSLIGHSMEQMILDPVFSVMQDSTISFPAVSASMEKALCDNVSPMKTPLKRGRAAATNRKSPKNSSSPAFTDALKQAQELLTKAHASALSTADSSMVRRISTLLQSTIIFLSATSASGSKILSQSGLATVAVDLARNVTWKREQQTLTAADSPTSSVPIPVTVKQAAELTPDMADFQKQFVDLIPEKWGVVSISLSDNRHDLCITKFQAGQSPFILRLPLGRANSRDADFDVFDFDHGRDELLDIIKLANESSHSARDFIARGERGAWWAEREALDSRLKDLLVTIETTWLGGFKGIFSQQGQRPELLARFQKDFHQLLDRSLPSRNKVRGKTTKSTTVTLDPRILELFIGLGDPTDPDSDFDEALNDLLYFVVDILQFHGERNAYDEIDFDAMVVETYDALRGYHNAASSTEKDDGAHTVLVLDKTLHAFPWESLPCMDGLSVSRVPSLACLRQLITEAESLTNDESTGVPQGHYVSIQSGTYILNPSSDLANTQTFFESAFSTLESWKGIVNKVPEEDAFEKALSTSDVMVYFGHGSGAQYIRGKTIRRLEKCKPATFLMGCSSAALTDAGEFECYGPVWNYMMAGCPAVVGTLWDVTDRDIDRFAGRTFEEWGLFDRGTFDGEAKGKGKGKAKSRQDEDDETDRYDGPNDASLAEAVARARGVCRFKYLNAAAVVLYGIPVYIKKE